MKRTTRGTWLGLVASPLLACSHEVESPAPTITDVEPMLLCSAAANPGTTVIGIRGTEFTPLPVDTLQDTPSVELPRVALTRTVLLDGSSVTEDAHTFSGVAGEAGAERLTWQSSGLLELSIDEAVGLESGLYDLLVVNPDQESFASRAAALAVVDSPQLSALEPGALCNAQVDQQLRITGENFLEVDGAGPRVHFATGTGESHSFQAETMDGCRAVEGAPVPLRVCSTIEVTIPANTLPESSYSVSVENTVCGASSTLDVNVLNEGPIVFFADPPVTYNGVNTRITLFMTEVAEPFTVSLAPEGELGQYTELESELVSGTDDRLQATVPVDQPEGAFDVIVNDGTGCQTRLAAGLTATADLSIELSNVTEPFGHTEGTTPITIFRSGGADFVATPRAFLNPVDGGSNSAAIQLESVTLVNSDELTAVVPDGAPVGRYDLVVVNPSGEVGLLADAYESSAAAPPVIADVVPQSIVNQAGQSITITGSGFSGATALARCQTVTNSSLAPTVSSTAETCAGGVCTVTATIDGGQLAPGDVCVVRITNQDGTYGEFSAIGATNSSYNLSAPREGRPLIEPRRGLVATSIKATSAARFVYAIGGDGGDPSEPYQSVEFAPVSVFGNMSDFVASPEPLRAPRVDAGGTQLGRYVYVVGGSDGAGALASAERALVLSPEEAPRIVDLDLCLSGGDTPCFGDAELGSGLPAGDYSYRVSAVIDPADPQNLGGETLASDPLPMRLPEVQGRGILPRVTWETPRDSLGDTLTGITGWRIYRTPAGGVAGSDEVLIAQLSDPDARAFVDDGSSTLGSEVPLPLGSTSAWQALPNLGVARTGLDAAAVVDPGDPTTFHVYALLGEGHTTYEYLDVSVLPNGRQTVGASWTTGAEEAAVARTQFGAWVVNEVVSSTVASGETYLYLGGGLATGGPDGRVEAALVTAGGELAAFSDDPTAGDIVTDFSSTRVGYGSAAAAGRLFVFGGLAANVRSDATAAELFNAAPELRNNSWNNEGLSMTQPRYRAGSALQSAFIFLIGGQTDAAGSVTATTEMVVW